MKRRKVLELIREAFDFAALCDECGKTVHADAAAEDYSTRTSICHECLGRGWRERRQAAAEEASQARQPGGPAMTHPTDPGMVGGPRVSDEEVRASQTAPVEDMETIIQPRGRQADLLADLSRVISARASRRSISPLQMRVIEAARVFVEAANEDSEQDEEYWTPSTLRAYERLIAAVVELDSTRAKRAAQPSQGSGRGSLPSKLSQPEESDGYKPRVSNSEAERLADYGKGYEREYQQDLALDLLDARAEITRLNLDAMTTEGQLQEAVASLRAELEAANRVVVKAMYVTDGWGQDFSEPEFAIVSLEALEELAAVVEPYRHTALNPLAVPPEGTPGV